VNAHSNIYGGEDSGWDGGGSHASGTTIKYCIDTSVSSTDAQKVMSAAAAWSGTCTFTKNRVDTSGQLLQHILLF